MVDESGTELKDYKFFCFNGIVQFFKIDYNRFTNHQSNYYDRDLNSLPIKETNFESSPKLNITLPSNIKEMIKLSEILSEGHPFLRVDLYNINGQIYFGELTFFPWSGFLEYSPSGADEMMGRFITIV